MVDKAEKSCLCQFCLFFRLYNFTRETACIHAGRHSFAKQQARKYLLWAYCVLTRTVVFIYTLDKLFVAYFVSTINAYCCLSHTKSLRLQFESLHPKIKSLHPKIESLYPKTESLDSKIGSLEMNPAWRMWSKPSPWLERSPAFCLEALLRHCLEILPLAQSTGLWLRSVLFGSKPFPFAWSPIFGSKAPKIDSSHRNIE